MNNWYYHTLYNLSQAVILFAILFTFIYFYYRNKETRVYQLNSSIARGTMRVLDKNASNLADGGSHSSLLTGKQNNINSKNKISTSRETNSCPSHGARAKGLDKEKIGKRFSLTRDSDKTQSHKDKKGSKTSLDLGNGFVNSSSSSSSMMMSQGDSTPTFQKIFNLGIGWKTNKAKRSSVLSHTSVTSSHLSNRSSSEVNTTAGPDKCAILIQSYYRTFKAKNKYQRAIKKSYVVKELLETEQSYVKSLRDLHQYYYKPLKNGAADTHEYLDSVINMTQVERIFFKAEEIQEIHHDMLREIQERVKHWNYFERIGDLFLDMTQSHLFVYSAYINNFDIATATLLEIREQSAMRKFLVERRKLYAIKEDLSDLLIAPVQRIPRYSLLLEQILKYTDKDHDDFFTLEKALTDLRTLTNTMNERKKAKQQVEKLGCKIINYPGEFSKTWRYLVSDSEVIELIKKKPKQRRIFVCNDLILCTSYPFRGMFTSSKASESYRYKWSVPLHEAEIRNEAYNLAGFESSSRHQEQQQQQQQQSGDHPRRKRNSTMRITGSSSALSEAPNTPMRTKGHKKNSSLTASIVLEHNDIKEEATGSSVTDAASIDTISAPTTPILATHTHHVATDTPTTSTNTTINTSDDHIYDNHHVINKSNNSLSNLSAYRCNIQQPTLTTQSQPTLNNITPRIPTSLESSPSEPTFSNIKAKRRSRLVAGSNGESTLGRTSRSFHTSRSKSLAYSSSYRGGSAAMEKITPMNNRNSASFNCVTEKEENIAKSVSIIHWKGREYEHHYIEFSTEQEKTDWLESIENLKREETMTRRQATKRKNKNSRLVAYRTHHQKDTSILSQVHSGENLATANGNMLTFRRRSNCASVPLLPQAAREREEEFEDLQFQIDEIECSIDVELNIMNGLENIKRIYDDKIARGLKLEKQEKKRNANIEEKMANTTKKMDDLQNKLRLYTAAYHTQNFTRDCNNLQH